MFVLVAYDVAAGRTEKFRRLLCRYLIHEQNSVFCGLLGQADFRDMEANLKAILVNGDRLLVLLCENRFNMEVTRLGTHDESVRMEKKSAVL